MNGGEVRLGLADSCWRDATPLAETRCTTALLVLPALVIRRGEPLSVRFATELSPISASMSVGGTTTPLAAGNPISLQVDLPTGTSTVSLSTRWLQGDARYRVTLDVLQALSPTTTPEPRTLALTG